MAPASTGLTECMEYALIVTLKRPCPVCAGRRGEFLHHQSYMAPRELSAPEAVDVVACVACGVGFSDLETSQELLDATYREHSKYADTSLYAEAADTYELSIPTDAPWDLERLAATADFLADLVPSGARVLDAGCATGALLGFLLQRGLTGLVGLDPSPLATQTAARTYGVTTCTGSFLTPPPELGDFDLVVLSHVLEHLTDVRGAVRGLRELTREGGLVYVEVPDAERYADHLVAPYHDFNTEHINHFSATTLRHLMQIHGFEEVVVDRKLVLCSPSDPYPVVFGVFRRPVGAAHRADGLPRDASLVDALRRYVEASESLERQLSDRVIAEAGDASVIVWGAGQLSMKLLAGPLQPVKIRAIVDTSASKWGMHVGDFVIQPPSALADDDAPILVTSIHHQDSIVRSVETMLGRRRLILLRP